MSRKLELMLEAERRGILPADKAAVLQEARRRGLVPGAGEDMDKAATSSQTAVHGLSGDNTEAEVHPLSKEYREPRRHPLEMIGGELWKNRENLKQAGVETYDKVGRPVIEGTGLVGGALAGAPGGPGSMALMAGLGYAGTKRLTKAADVALGLDEPETIPEAFVETGKDMMTGSAIEAGGQVFGKAIPPVAKYAGRKLKGAAQKVYQSAAKMSTTIPQAERSRLAETALREGIAPTQKGLGKLAELERTLIGQIDEAVEEATRRGGKVPTQSILNKLDDVYEMARLSDDPAGYRRVVDAVADKFRLHGDTLTVKDAHQIKRNIYKLLPSRAYEPSYTGHQSMKIKARKAIGRGAKEAVEAEVPGIKEMNARAKELIELSKVLERAVSRIENRNLIGLNDELAAIVGVQLGGAPGAAGLGVGRSLLGLPRIKAKIAMELYRAGGASSRLAEVFAETPAGKELLQDALSAKSYQIMESRIPIRDKERFLAKLFEK